MFPSYRRCDVAEGGDYSWIREDKMHLLPKRSGRLAGPLVAAATWGLLGLAGCDQNGTTADMNPNMDMSMTVQPPGPPTKATAVATADRPLAAVLTPDAQTIYLTAHDA